jgi:hypothetical protein
MHRRTGIILPTVMIAFIMTIVLFAIGMNNIPINTRAIKKVKEKYDYHSILSNFHQLSLAKTTQLADNNSDLMDLLNNTAPSDGFSNFYDEFSQKLSKAIFTSQWTDVKKQTSSSSSHELILQYEPDVSDTDPFITVFKNYLNNHSEKENIAGCESVIIKLNNSTAKLWIVNRLKLKDGTSFFSAALIHGEHHYNDDYFYFTQTEGDIWFTDDDIINGPLASMDTIHISGNPQFNGTVYYNPEQGEDGFEYYDEHSEGIFKGEPATSPLPTDTSFATISSEYKQQFQNDFISFSQFFSTGLSHSGLSANTGRSLRYSVAVPEGTEKITVKTIGNNGDADLFVAMNYQPSRSSNDGYSEKSGSNETVVISNPVQGTCHILVYSYSRFRDVSLNVSVEPGKATLFDFATYSDYQASVTEDPIDFKNTQALVLDYNTSDYDIDLEDNKISINWISSDNRLDITFAEVSGQEDTYQATYTFTDGSNTNTISGVPFSGFISAGDNRIYLGDHNNSNGGDLCFYEGKLTFQTTDKIFVEDSIIPSELKNISGFELKPREYWDATQTNTVKEYFKNGAINASMNLVTDDNIYIGSKNYGGGSHAGERPKDNQKIFASLFSFDETISVADYDSSQLGPKGQLTIFGSLMQETRGAVGTFGSVSNEVYYNQNYEEYRRTGNIIQGRHRYWSGGWWGHWNYGNWTTLYTIPEDKVDSYQVSGRSGANHNNFVRVFYSTTDTLTGYDKNYYFDPRFNNGYIQGAGAPQSEGITILLSGNIEVY